MKMENFRKLLSKLYDGYSSSELSNAQFGKMCGENKIF